MLIQILLSILPILVSLAEKLFPSGQGSSKKAWVQIAVHDLLSSVQKVSPDWLKPFESALEPLVSQLIEYEVGKLP